MVDRVRNAIGGTADRPCPTSLSRFLGRTDYCNSDDARAWLAAAVAMWETALSPTWDRIVAAAEDRGDELDDAQRAELAQLDAGVTAYKTDYDELPDASFWSERNMTTVTRTVALMTQGDELLDRLQAFLRALEIIPPDLPPDPRMPVPTNGGFFTPLPRGAKPPWQRYLFPAGVASSAVLLTGIVLVVAAGEGE